MKTLDFKQTTPAATWTINHNFGTTVLAVDAWISHNGNNEAILPQNIVVSSENTIVISFSAARTGGARIVAKPVPA